MRETVEPRPGDREVKARRPYVAPAFESETVFETMALRCGKTQSEDGGGDRVKPGLRMRVYNACGRNKKNS